jgi:hypothetical protein
VDEERQERRRSPLRVGTLFALSCALLLVIPAAVLGPYVLDDRKLDAIVKVVALDWRDFGEERARGRLEVELDQRSVGSQVRDEDCRFEQEGDDRVVRCAWTVQVEVLLLDRTFPLSFQSTARITGSGDMRPR